MLRKGITEEIVEKFHRHLELEEKSEITIEKYIRDVRMFAEFLKEEEISKEQMIKYKKQLMEKGYASRSVNSMLASVNSLLEFLGYSECKVKSLHIQHEAFQSENKELTKDEYQRLLRAAEKRPQLQLMLETICGTGIRVSELRFFTVEAVKIGEITVQCKSKIRTILIPKKLKKKLLCFAGKNKIQSGAIFVTKNGKPVDRTKIWAQMKALCGKAHVKKNKVFPHNLRKLFARTFYKIERDIAKLADVLGHSSINTTRIYIISTGTEHRSQIERLGLIL